MRWIAVAVLLTTVGWGQRQDPLGYSVPTPHPINPAEGTTNPSAVATQRQNPFLGSVPSPLPGAVELSLRGAIERGLRYNLGLVESTHASADVRTDRLRALAVLLPQLSARATQAFEDISFKEIGVKLPPIPGFSLPPTSRGYGYQDARVELTQSIYDGQLQNQYRARKSSEESSLLSTKDSRDVVVFAVGTAYLQVIASQARADAARAQLASARELDRQTSDRVSAEVSPEIDSLRALVERQAAEQRLTNAANQFEKDKLTLGRIVGLPVEQSFVLTEQLTYRPLSGVSYETAIEQALSSRADLKAAESAVHAAEATLRAEKAQRLPVISVNANYGGGGTNIGNLNQVYSVAGSVSVPIYTGGRIHADIEQAQADLGRKEAEYADLKGRIAYDLRVAWLDLGASDSSIAVAERNKALANKALVQSQDRYANGVTNYVEVVQAEEAQAAATNNCIESLYSYNCALIVFARAMGDAETRLFQLLGGK